MTIPASDLLTRLQALLAERDKWVLVSVVKKWDAEHKVFDLMPEIVAALSQQQEMQQAVTQSAREIRRLEKHVEELRAERDAALIKLATLEQQIQRVRAELATVGERE